VGDDPILRQRARMARLARVGQRLGYALILVSIVAFAVGLVLDFPPTVAVIVTAALAGATVTLAPSIVLGYAVKAAEREEREQRGQRGRQR
jgi:Na+/proline symporter